MLLLQAAAGFHWEVITSLGASAGTVATVVLFLRHMKSLQDSYDKNESVRLEAISKLGDACHRHQAEQTARMTEVINKNTESLEKSLETFGRVAEAMRKYE